MNRNKNKDYQKEYVKNMSDEQKQKLRDYRTEIKHQKN